jgi:TetR/AcrR family transcriptional regulator, transcriptional repressor for nem operon
MTRPKEFNQDQAIWQAIALFSQRGFTVTSTDDLMHVMGISRQSRYDTFGDKRALFLKALELDVTESVRRIQLELEKPGPPLSAVTNALVTFAERKDMASASGCMGLNAISEFGEGDADVTRISRIAARSQRDILRRVLEKAKERGELDPA